MLSYMEDYLQEGHDCAVIYGDYLQVGHNYAVIYGGLPQGRSRLSSHVTPPSNPPKLCHFCVLSVISYLSY